MTDDKKPIELTNAEDGEKGRIATKMMFKQYNKKGKECLEDWRERFVSTLDPTEYSGAIELLGSWSQWEKFKRNWPSFERLYLQDWLDEIEVRLKSLAVRGLVKDVQYGKSPTASAKFLAEAKYKERKAGRPSKEDIKRQIKRDSKLDKEIANDLERIGL